MAVYEKKLPQTMRLVVRVFEILEPILNYSLNRRFITFLFRNLKLGKVTRFIKIEDFRFGG